MINQPSRIAIDAAKLLKTHYETPKSVRKKKKEEDMNLEKDEVTAQRFDLFQSLNGITVASLSFHCTTVMKPVGWITSGTWGVLT
jgi:hypothetical protein